MALGGKGEVGGGKGGEERRGGERMAVIDFGLNQADFLVRAGEGRQEEEEEEVIAVALVVRMT